MYLRQVSITVPPYNFEGTCLEGHLFYILVKSFSIEAFVFSYSTEHMVCQGEVYTCEYLVFGKVVRGSNFRTPIALPDKFLLVFLRDIV